MRKKKVLILLVLLIFILVQYVSKTTLTIERNNISVAAVNMAEIKLQRPQRIRPVRKRPELGAVDVRAGFVNTIGLRNDGTIVIAGSDHNFVLNDSELRDVVAISLGNVYDGILLKSDGTAVKVGNWYHDVDVREENGFYDLAALEAGDYHVVGLKSNGIVIASGDNEFGQCQTTIEKGFNDIVAIAAGKHHTVALKSDGTVIAIGDNSYGQCETTKEKGFSDIVAIDAGGNTTVALRADGTVVATGDNAYNQCDTNMENGFSDIVDVSTSGMDSIGLKSDGSVVAVGYNKYGKDDAVVDNGFTDIVAIDTGYCHIVGLKSDGTVVSTGDNYSAECNTTNDKDFKNLLNVAPAGNGLLGVRFDGTVVSSGSFQEHTSVDIGFSGIVDITAGQDYVVGLKGNGRVVASKRFDETYDKGQCEVSDWKDIITIATGKEHTVGLRSDGTVVAVGNNVKGQCNVSDWRDIIAIAVGDNHTVGLKSDGTVVAVGDNSNGQCNVNGLRNIKFICANYNKTVCMGLKSEGMYIVEFDRGYNYECNYPDINYSEITQMAVFGGSIALLKSDGRVFFTNGCGSFDEQFIQDYFKDLIQIKGKGSIIVGVKMDGTIVAVNGNYIWHYNSDWNLINPTSRSSEVSTFINENRNANIEIEVLDYSTDKPINAARVNIGDKSVITNAEGKATFNQIHYGFNVSVSIEAEGYLLYSSQMHIANKNINKTVYLHSLKAEGKPYVSSVTCIDNNKNVRELIYDDSFTIDKLDKVNYVIEAKVDWNGTTEGEISIIGSNSNTKFKMSKGKVILPLGQIFQGGEEIYILAESKDGEFTVQKLGIKVFDPLRDDVLEGLANFQIPKVSGPAINIPFFDGKSFMIGTEKFGILKDAEVKVEDKKVKVKFGLYKNDIVKGTDYLMGKSTLFKNVDIFGNDSAKAEIYGYLEIPLKMFDKNGTFTGYVGLSFGGDSKESLGSTGKVADLEYQMALGFTPILVKVQLNVGFDAKVPVAGDINNIGPLKSTLNLATGLKFNAGIGVIKAANVTGFVEGTGGVEVKFDTNQQLSPKFEFRCGVAVELARHEWEATMLKLTFPDQIQNTIKPGINISSQFKLVGRDYIKSSNSWVGSNVMKSAVTSNQYEKFLLGNVFPNSETGLGTIGQNPILVFTKDDLSRTAVNGLQLVYSKQVDGAWTEPVSLDDDKTADGDFSIKSDENNTFCIWENTKKVLGDSETDLKTVMSNSEIKVSKFNLFTGNWETPITLTNNSIADFYPVISMKGDKAVAVWLSNDSSDIFCSEGNTDINYTFYNGKSWSSVQSIKNVGMICGTSLAFDGTNAIIAYEKDNDSNKNTVEDRDIYYRNLLTPQLELNITNDLDYDSGAEIVCYDNKFLLSWLSEKKINIISDLLSNEKDVTTIDSGTVSSYSASPVVNMEKLYLMWGEESDGYKGLYCSIFDKTSRSWGYKKEVLAGSFNVKNANTLIKDDGSILTAYLQSENPTFTTNTDGTLSVVKGKADLYVSSIVPGCNVSIIANSIVYNDNQYAKRLNTDVGFDLLNKGEKSVESINVSVYDGKPGSRGTLLSTQTINRLIKPGEKASLRCSFNPLYVNQRRELYIKVDINNETDYDTSDNVAGKIIGGSNISVDSAYFSREKNKYILNSTISNKGSIAASNILVELHEDSPSGTVVYSENIDELLPGELSCMKKIIPADAISIIGDVKKYYVTAKLPSGQDYLEENNEMLAVIEKEVKYDLNGDDQTNIIDLAAIARKYNTKISVSDLSSCKYDLNSDNIVNIFDLVILSKSIH